MNARYRVTKNRRRRAAARARWQLRMLRGSAAVPSVVLLGSYPDHATAYAIAWRIADQERRLGVYLR